MERERLFRFGWVFTEGSGTCLPSAGVHEVYYLNEVGRDSWEWDVTSILNLSPQVEWGKHHIADEFLLTSW